MGLSQCDRSAAAALLQLQHGLGLGLAAEHGSSPDGTVADSHVAREIGLVGYIAVGVRRGVEFAAWCPKTSQIAKFDFMRHSSSGKVC